MFICFGWFSFGRFRSKGLIDNRTRHTLYSQALLYILFVCCIVFHFLSLSKRTLLGKEITLTPVPVAKDLGVYIDQSLTYNDHIAKTTSNCIFKLIQISRIKHLLDRKTLLLLMNAFVFSKMYYCSPLWANTCQSNLKKLQLVQNFAARIVLDLKKFDHIRLSRHNIS